MASLILKTPFLKQTFVGEVQNADDKIKNLLMNRMAVKSNNTIDTHDLTRDPSKLKQDEDIDDLENEFNDMMTGKKNPEVNFQPVRNDTVVNDMSVEHGLK